MLLLAACAFVVLVVVAWLVRGPRLPKRNCVPVQWPRDAKAQRMAAGLPVLDTADAPRKDVAMMPTCFNCHIDVEKPTILADEEGHRFLACDACATLPWPMYAVDEEDEEEYAAEVKRLARQVRVEARRTELATIPANDLRVIIEEIEADKEALVERAAHLEEQHQMMMVELEDALSVRDSLSDQLVSTNARLNVHKKEYPRMFYHRDGKTAIVQDADAGRVLRRTGQWFDHPDKAEASRQRVYNLKKPTETVINETPDGKLAAMSPAARQAAMHGLAQRDAGHKPEVDRDRIDVKIDVLERPKLPGNVE